MRASLLTLVLVGCGGSGGGGGTPREGPYADVLGAVCGALDRCPDGIGRPIAYRSRAQCMDILDFVLTCRLTDIEVGDVTTFEIEQQPLEVDREAADGCIAWLTTASCEEIARGGEETPCSRVLGRAEDDDDDGGGAAVDQPCDYDDDCQADLYCTAARVDREAGVEYCQLCRPRLAAGAECQQGTRQCAEGLHCAYRMDGPRVCAPPDADGVECVEHEQCASGFCNFALTMTGGLGLCDAGGNEGAPCTEPAGCRPDFFCETTCQPRRPNGDPCTDHVQCERGNCDVASGRCGYADGAPCSYGYECASNGCIGGMCGSGPGGSCSSDEDCPEGQICPWDSSTCEAPRADGTSCDRDEECVSAYCTFDDTCATRPALGDPCSETEACGPLAWCSGGVCVERFGPGESCTGLESCLEPFLCRNGHCEVINLACRPAAAGEQCAFFRVCDEDSYCDLFDGVTCKRRSRVGERCSPSPLRGVEVCAAGSHCVSDESGESTCRPRVPLGGACTSPAECVEGSYCAAGVCEGDPVGRPCDYDTPCPAGLYCGDREEVCLRPGGAGAACRDHFECQGEYFCESVSCEPRLGVGERCNDQEECRPELHCDGSYTCQPDRAAGEMCDTRWDECAEGLHCPFSGSMNVCVAQGGAGSECDSGEDCLSGACYSSDFCLASAECVVP